MQKTRRLYPVYVFPVIVISKAIVYNATPFLELQIISNNEVITVATHPNDTLIYPTSYGKYFGLLSCTMIACTTPICSAKEECF